MNETLGPEAEAFLQQQPNLILGTIRRDGSPQASPVWFLWVARTFLVSTIDSTAKWHNLQKDRRCSACIDDPGTGRMIVASGEADLHGDDVEARTRAIVEKYYPGDPLASDAHMRRIFGSDAARRVLIEMVPDRLIGRGLDE